MDESRPLRDQVEGASVLIPTTGVVTAEDIAAAPRLRLITQPASGYNNIDVGQAERQGVPVCIAPGVNAQSVAEQALLMMLMLARKADGQRQAFAQRRIGEPPTIRQLGGKQLGIIGLGAIGRCLEQAAHGLGMRVVGVHSRSGRAEFERLLADSDVVSVHCPATPATVGLLGAAELAMMRPGALLLNLARGEVVQRQALEDALDSGHLGGVGLDVHWQEPADPREPLYKHPKVLAMPHAGVCCQEVYDAYAELLVDNIVRCKEGRPLRHQLEGRGDEQHGP